MSPESVSQWIKEQSDHISTDSIRTVSIYSRGGSWECSKHWLGCFPSKKEAEISINNYIFDKLATCDI